MREKRMHRRFSVNLQVSYGLSESMMNGVTADVSIGGIHIMVASPLPRGSYLKIELTTPDNGVVAFIGRVQWAKDAGPDLRETGGMGVKIVRFLSGSGIYKLMCDTLRKQERSGKPVFPR